MSDKLEMSMREKADAAFRRAVEKIIARAKLHGTRIVGYDNGEIVERTWQEVEEAIKQQSMNRRDE